MTNELTEEESTELVIAKLVFVKEPVVMGVDERSFTEWPVVVNVDETIYRRPRFYGRYGR